MGKSGKAEFSYSAPPAEMTSSGALLEKPFVLSRYAELMAHPGNMLVIGSGGNSEMWRRRGARTLDINRKSGADIIADANKLKEALEGKNPFNVIYLEDVNIDESMQNGINLVVVLRQAYDVLLPGGEVFILTATAGVLPEGPDVRLPSSPVEWLKKIQETGFGSAAAYRSKAITGIEKQRVIGDKVLIDDYYINSKVIYYGKKPIG